MVIIIRIGEILHAAGARVETPATKMEPKMVHAKKDDPEPFATDLTVSDIPDAGVAISLISPRETPCGF
jgi:hypothetical protein